MDKDSREQVTPFYEAYEVWFLKNEGAYPRVKTYWFGVTLLPEFLRNDHDFKTFNYFSFLKVMAITI